MSGTPDGGDLRIVPLEAGHVDALTEVMTRSFDDDARRHLGVPKGGPPGYDTGEFLRRHGLDPSAGAFAAALGGRLVGAVIAFPRRDGDHVLGCIFTEPLLQRRGIGTALFRHVEAAFRGRSWTLETPGFASSNHAFYEERCGFHKVAERPDPEGHGPMFVFEKRYADDSQAGAQPTPG
jgi:GNAT superfamily N-acetyltransferase